MLDFARRLTRAPGEIRRRDIDRLRGAGFDDGGVVDLVAVVGYFNFINRVALGLGVRLDESLRDAADPAELRRELARLDGEA